MKSYFTSVFVILFAIATARGADIQSVGIEKKIVFAQNSAGAPGASATGAYTFSANVSGSNQSANVVSASLKLPNNTTVPLILSQDNYSVSASFDTQAAMDAAYPAGNYSITLTTVNDGTRTLNFVLPATSLPPAPHISNYTAAQSIVPNASFALQWDLWSGQTSDWVRLQANPSVGGSSVIKTGSPGAPDGLSGANTSYTIAANTLVLGTAYSGSLRFEHFSTLDTTTYPGVFVFTGMRSETLFSFATASGTSNGVDVESYGLEKKVAYHQSDSGAPTLVSNSFQFEASVSPNGSNSVLSASVRLPDTSTRALQSTDEGFEFSSSFASQAALDAAFPPGNYGINISTARNGQKTFNFFNYPATVFPPALHVSNYSAAQNVNPGADFVLSWDSVAGTADLIEVEIEGDNTNFFFGSPSAGSPNSLTGAATSFTIPANVLPAAQSFTASIRVYKVLSFDNTAYPGAIGYQTFRSKTEFSLKTSAAVPAPSIQTSYLPNGLVGASYSATLKAAGGSAPYTWSLAPGTIALPSGLALSSSGTISGTASVPGTANLTLRVRDANGLTADRPLTLTINQTGGTPALTVSPASVAADYKGIVELNITGLTQGQSVLVEKLVDFNGNGVVDGNDTVVESFVVVDGRVTTIGGIRNPNIPGDEDGSINGQIQVKRSMQAASEGDRFIGSYYYRVTGLSAGFSPVKRPFSVTSPNFGQTVSGKITVNGSPLPYAIVAVLVQTGDSSKFAGGTVADANGNYSVSVKPGGYLVLPLTPGYIGAFSSSAQVAVSAGVNATLNVAVTPATRTLSGKIVDAIDGTGLPNLQMFFSDENNATIGWTDNQGNFSVGVGVGLWRADDVGDAGLVRLGYLTIDSEDSFRYDTTSGNVSGVITSFPRVDALIFGKFQDAHGNPLAGLEVQAASDFGNDLQSPSFTDSSGNYVVGVTGGTWRVGARHSSDLTALGLISVDAHLTITPGVALQKNLTFPVISVPVTGKVLTSTGTGLGNVEVEAYRTDGDGDANATASADGSYFLGLVGGSWAVETHHIEDRGYVRTQIQRQFPDGVAQSIDLISYKTNAIISGIIKNSSGAGIADLTVRAYSGSNSTNYQAEARSDANGNFKIFVFNGCWQIYGDSFELSQRGYSFTSVQACVDPNQNTSVIITVPQPGQLIISNTSLQDGIPSSHYHEQFQSTGGQGNISWSLSSGTLPPGLNLSPDGQLDGLPTALGNYTFTVRVSDTSGHSDQRTFTVSVNANFNFELAFFFQRGTLNPSGQANVSGSAIASYWASVGVQDVDFPASVTFTGPAGSGLSATPSASFFSGRYGSPFLNTPPFPPGGTYTVNYKNQDKTFVVVDSQASTRQIIPVPTVTLNGNNIQQVSWTYRNSNGTTVSTPGFITGLTLSVQGRNGGSEFFPDLPANTTSQVLNNPFPWDDVATVQISFRDNLGYTYTADYDRTSPDLVFVTTSLPDATVGASYHFLLQQSGGFNPVSWSLFSGGLPGGITLNTVTGELNGTANAAGTFNVTIRLSDAQGRNVNQALSLRVVGTVTSPQISAAILKATGQIQVTINGQPGKTYQIEGIDAFAQPNTTTWSLHGTVTADANGQAIFVESLSAAKKQFFRAVAVAAAPGTALAPTTINNRTMRVSLTSGPFVGASYDIVMTGGNSGNFFLANGSEGDGTYSYSASGNEATLILIYQGLPGDKDTMFLHFSAPSNGAAGSGTAGTFTGNQDVSEQQGLHNYSFSGTFNNFLPR